MKPVFQTKFGADGNCWPACLASLLEIPIEETDHCSCVDHPGWIQKTNEFLAARGLYYLQIDTGPDGLIPGGPIPEGQLVILRVTGKTGLPHVVIARARWFEERHETGECAGLEFIVVHDPSPTPTEPYKADAVIYLCKLDTIT